MTQTLSRPTFPLSRAPGLVHRPAGDRFHSEHGWLDSWHTFSFAGHFDPAWSGFGPLLVINDDTVQARNGFGWHPHRDMEIISVIVDGELTHRDSMGHTQILRPGDVQCLSAGSGIIHSEINEGERPCRFLQIWIEPHSLGIPPGYRQRHYGIDGGWTLLIDPAPTGNALTLQRSVRLWRAGPSPERTLPLPIAAGTRGWLQIIDGAVDVALQAERSEEHARLGPGDGLGFPSGSVRSLTASACGADLLLFELR